MRKSDNCYSFAANLGAANSTVNNVIVRASVYTIWSNVVLNNYLSCGVTLCRNGFLFDEDFVTYRAMATFGKTGFSASRCYCRINHRSVAVCTNSYCFAAEFSAANGTVNNLIIGSGALTIRNCVVFNNSSAFCVAFSRNNLLCNENFATFGAVLTRGKTCFSAGRCYCRINYFGVRELINSYRFTAELLTASGTVNYVFVGACHSTGRVLAVFDNSFACNMLMLTDYYSCYCFFTIGVVGNYNLCRADTGEG